MKTRNPGAWWSKGHIAGIGRGIAIVVVWFGFHRDHDLEFGQSPGCGFGSSSSSSSPAFLDSTFGDGFRERGLNGICQLDKGRGFHRVLGAGRKVQVGGGLNS